MNSLRGHRGVYFPLAGECIFLRLQQQMQKSLGFKSNCNESLKFGKGGKNNVLFELSELFHLYLASWCLPIILIFLTSCNCGPQIISDARGS